MSTVIAIICSVLNVIIAVWVSFRFGKQDVTESLSKALMRAGKLLAYDDMLIEQLKQENEHLKKVIDGNADKSNQGE